MVIQVWQTAWATAGDNLRPGGFSFPEGNYVSEMTPFENDELYGLFFDREGKKIGVLRWGSLFEDLNYRFVANTIIKGYRISTIWLGIDHNFGWLYDGGPHVIFESMVFGPEGASDLDTDRYINEDMARRGHRKMVSKWARELKALPDEIHDVVWGHAETVQGVKDGADTGLPEPAVQLEVRAGSDEA